MSYSRLHGTCTFVNLSDSGAPMHDSTRRQDEKHFFDVPGTWTEHPLFLAFQLTQRDGYITGIVVDPICCI
jgi:hypothetical protein